MLSIASVLRSRAKDCRNIAKGVRHFADRVILEDTAADLERLAAKVSRR